MIMHHNEVNPSPAAFCWTRFGPEAGESFGEILSRKEAERQAGEGVFYWGIGSAIGPALRTLVTRTDEPEVLFSPIRTAPRPVDASPDCVVRWWAGEGLSGERVDLPAHACVTSRWDPLRPNTARYALVCGSDDTLRSDDHGDLCFGSLLNLRSGAPIGASQVTAVVRHDRTRPRLGRAYRVALRTSLVWPYLIRLASPEIVDSSATEEPGTVAV